MDGDFRFREQVAVVTGGGQGIGRHIALRLAREGASVVIGDINRIGADETANMIRKMYGRKARAVTMDVLSEKSVQALIDEAVDVTGRIDILVNNSGITGPMKAIDEITAEEWDLTMGVNVRGVFFCCKAAIPFMKKQKKGTIVNISSVTGKRALVHRMPYAASKIAVIGLTRTLAAELGEYGIRVNSICPGPVAGPRMEKVFEGIMKRTGMSHDEAVEDRLSLTALKCFVEPEDVAGMVAFLCSADASKITGQDLNVSAGSLMY